MVCGVRLNWQAKELCKNRVIVGSALFAALQSIGAMAVRRRGAGCAHATPLAWPLWEGESRDQTGGIK